MNFRGKNDAVFPLMFQVTSFVDILLVLVIFLVVTSTQAPDEADLRVAVPGANNAQKQSAPSRIILNILKDGSVVLNGQTKTGPELTETLGRLVKNDPKISVILRADKQASYETVLGVVDLCEGAQVESVGFSALKR